MQQEIYSDRKRIKPAPANMKKKLLVIYNILFWAILFASIIATDLALPPGFYYLGRTAIFFVFGVILMTIYCVILRYFTNRFLLKNRKRFGFGGKIFVALWCAVSSFLLYVMLELRGLIGDEENIIFIAPIVITPLYFATNRLICRIKQEPGRS